MQAYSFLAGRCAGFPFEMIQDSIFMTKKCGFCKRLCYNPVFNSQRKQNAAVVPILQGFYSGTASF